ncbi:MAG: glycoside hydrolase family 31 protein [Candidatus Obscuribacterales bacterium]|nr:glycoside hydrolase family 31 protein [Candidatus Obscuribacterales bacterium]
MKQLESPTDWLEARKIKTRGREEQRPANIFAGGSSCDSAEIQGVVVSRLSVYPKGSESAPRTFAVIEPEESSVEGLEAEGEATWFWKRSSKDQQLLDFEWQQSSESRWNFYFKLPKDAMCFGLGERLSGFNLRGRVHTLFNHSDNMHVPTLDPLYKSIPFLLIRHQGRYQGIFLDSPARQRWSLDVELEEQASIELLSRRGFTVYLFETSSLPDLLAAYTALTGRSKLPPNWSLGHQQSRWSYPDESTVLAVAAEFRTRNIPCDAIVLDIDFMDEYRVFTSSPERFPNFKEMIAKLQDQNFRVVTIVDPGVKKDAKYFVYRDGKKHDYFCKKADGKTFYGKVWPGQSVFPDFLREDVRLWWAALHGFLVENNVSGVWNDMNEPCLFGQGCPLPLDAIELPKEHHQLFMQQSPEGDVGHFEVRNLYGLEMSRATWEGLTALRPDERPFVLSRAGYAGIQRYAAVWLGDNMSWWEHLAVSVPMLLNVGLSGVPFCGVDVGGFGDDCSPELLARWYALAMFYPFFRNHCSKAGAEQEPWSFNQRVEDAIRHFVETRYRLLPYIRCLFWEHIRTGAPLMRPIIWDYPEDQFAAEIDDQFLFGRDILVTPIVKRGQTERSVYLPNGLWYPFDGGEPLEGGRLHKVGFELDEVPAFVRDGSIVPFVDLIQSTDYYELAPITFKVWGDHAMGLYLDDDGISFEYEEDGYNEWLLRYDNGQFSSNLANFGYIAPEREYYFQHGLRKERVHLARE